MSIIQPVIGSRRTIGVMGAAPYEAADGAFGGHSTLSTDIVSYWKFDGDLTDSHGSNDATNQGTSDTASGKINNARDFDGANDRIELGDDLTATTTGSISMWVYPEDINQGNNSLLNIKQGTDGNDRFLLRLYDGDAGQSYDGKVNFIVRPGGVTTFNIYGNTVLSNTNWYHIVITNDGSLIRMYVNNTLQTLTYLTGSSSTVDWWDDIPATAEWFLGTQYVNGSYQDYFDGVIDEVGIWEKQLSTQEISDLYNSGSGLQY